MALLTAATHPAVGGGPSASDSGDCGIEDFWMLVVFLVQKTRDEGNSNTK